MANTWVFSKNISSLLCIFAIVACSSSTERVPSVPEGKKLENNNTSEVQAELSEKNYTRNIETSGGPREVYDPTKDPEVITAFSTIYKTPNEHVLDYSSPKASLHMAYKRLEDAAARQRISLAKAGCTMIADSNCGSGWRVEQCPENWATCTPKITALSITTRSGCQREDRDVYDKNAHPIGPNFFRSGPYSDIYKNKTALSENEQLQNYFAIQCNF